MKSLDNDIFWRKAVQEAEELVRQEADRSPYKPERKNLDLSPVEKAKIQREALQRRHGG